MIDYLPIINFMEQEPTTDLEMAYAVLAAKKPVYDVLWDYYDGDQPVVYTARRLQDIFDAIDARFNENWCSVVIDAVLDRMMLNGFAVADDESAEEALERDFKSLHIELTAKDVHKGALVCGESFVLLWPDEDNVPQLYYNDPRLCHVFYRSDAPNKKRYACKWFIDDEYYLRLILYYSDRIETYRSVQKAKNVSSVKSFELLQIDSNPFETIPVFHFRVEERLVKSDLKNVIPLQNAINKLLIDMMVTAEFGAFKQRYIISGTETSGKLRNAPNEIWDLPAGDGVGQPTQVGQLESSDLASYYQAINQLAAAIGAISRTPRHYFFQQSGDPSGESLIAMEAPLNKKTQDRIDRFIPIWQELAAFMLMLRATQVDITAIQPLYTEPETVQPLTEALIIYNETRAGVPLLTALRKLGWSADQLEKMQEDQKAEDDRAKALMPEAIQSDDSMNTGDNQDDNGN